MPDSKLTYVHFLINHAAMMKLMCIVYGQKKWRLSKDHTAQNR